MFYLKNELDLIVKEIEEIQKNNNLNLFEFLYENYKKDYKSFHRAFLHSGIALGMNKDAFNKLIDLFSELKYPETMINDMSFFRDKVKIYKSYDQKLKDEINRTTAEEIIGFIEYAVVNLNINNVGFDTKIYSEKVLESQKGFLISHYYDILIELYKHTQFSKVQKKSYKNNYALLYPIVNTIAQKYSLKAQLMSVCTEQEKPIPATTVIRNGIGYMVCNLQDQIFGASFGQMESLSEPLKGFNEEKSLYALFFTQDFWKVNQIQRDLTERYLNFHIFDTDESMEMMQKTGFMRYDKSTDTMYFNYEKGKKFSELKKQFEPEKILSQIYSIDEATFVYKTQTYKIRELVDICLNIQDHAERQHSHNSRNFNLKSHEFFDIDGPKSFSRKVKLKECQKELIELFIWDIKETKNKKNNQFKPVIKVDNLLYSIPSLIRSLPLDTIVDGVLSQKEIEKTLSQKKGLNFEKELESFFFKKGIKFFKLEKDELKDSSEIDGMFVYEDSLFIYEAKASIIQQNIVEMYDYLNSTIYKKAYKQLVKRVDYIVNNRVSIETKFGIRINPKKIYPIIVMNHATYTGYQGFFIPSIKKEVAIIDYKLLKYSMENNKSINWTYDNDSEVYKVFEKQFSNAKDLFSYLQKPYRDLQSIDKPTIQITENGVAFYIVQDGKIDYLSSLYSSKIN